MWITLLMHQLADFLCKLCKFYMTCNADLTWNTQIKIKYYQVQHCRLEIRTTESGNISRPTF